MNPRKSDSAFTLLEVMVAMIVLLIGLVAVAQMIPLAGNSNLNNRTNSVALIAVQRELSQIAMQSLTATATTCTNGTPPTGSYSFCDTDGDPIALGPTSAGSVPVSSGCPLTTGKTGLDFSQALTSCPAGYYVTKTMSWDQVDGITQKVEIRWNVVVEFSSGTPYKKFIVMGARALSPTPTTLVNDVQTVISK